MIFMMKEKPKKTVVRQHRQVRLRPLHRTWHALVLHAIRLGIIYKNEGLF